jgi:hypothetical protein
LISCLIAEWASLCQFSEFAQSSAFVLLTLAIQGVFMRVKAPKPKMLSDTGDFEVDVMLHAYRAKKKLAKDKRQPRWQQAAAAAADRRLLIGNCRLFKSPR